MNQNYFISRLSFSLLFLGFFSLLQAQAPTGYYDASMGKKKDSLKTAMWKIISKNVKVQTYGTGTWAAYQTTDVRPDDGTVWDMYSDNHRDFNGTSAPSGMNIEHAFPKSWWGGTQEDAYFDILQLRPADAAANSAKSNYVMNVVTSTTWTNRVTTVGKDSRGVKAWEPADEYKGDFAREYMYMVTRYEDYSTLWTSNGISDGQLLNNTYPVFTDWTIALLLKWSRQDPVSTKEITLNNAAYKIQNNRNPFIDYPHLCEYIWGDSVDYAFNPGNLGNTVITPEFSQTAGSYTNAFTLKLSCATSGATIYYTIDGTTPTVQSTLYDDANGILIAANTTVKVIAIKDGMTASDVATAYYRIGTNANVASSIKEYKAFTADGTTSYTLNFTNVLVTANTNSNLYIQDSEAGLLIFGSNANWPSLKKGDVISGTLTASLTVFKGTVEAKSATLTYTLQSSGNTENPIIVTMNDLITNSATYESRLIKLEGVNFAAATLSSSGVNISQAGYSISCYDKFKTLTSATFVTDRAMDVVGIANLYNTEIEISPRGTDDITSTSTSISSVKADQLSVFASNGVISVKAVAKSSIVVRDEVGRTLYLFTLHAGESTSISLPHGLYFVNERKVIL